MSRVSRQFKGQALVEFILVMAILVPLLLATAYVGMAMYAGAIASDAIREPVMHKLEMASTPGAVSSGQVLTMAQEGAQGSVKMTGSPLDSAEFIEGDGVTSIIVGKKTFNSPFTNLGIPSFNFTVTQGINANLLLAANNGATVRESSWTNTGGTAPWQRFDPKYALQSGLALHTGCGQTNTLNQNNDFLLRGVSSNLGEGSYFVVDFPTYTTSVETETIVNMAERFRSECAGTGSGVCQAEYNNLKFKDSGIKAAAEGPPPSCSGPLAGNPICSLPFESYQEIYNPPGAPGQVMLITKAAGATVAEATTIPFINMMTHGIYYGVSADKNPPEDFVPSCIARKEAECMLERAVNQANSMVSSSSAECAPI